MSEYKFKAGDIFVLKPNARVKWIVFVNHSGFCTDALRTDSELGIAIIKWLESKLDADKPDVDKVRAAVKTFCSHDLETAVIAI